ncbi:MAG: hypothetical protein KIG55_09410 [Myroides sp.]|nr:hypothetical protein [Myroides sp.]
MRLTASLLLILTMYCKSYSQEKNCSAFWTGTFSYADKEMPYRIVRDESIQIETNTDTGDELHTSIEWKSDCEYILTYIKIKYPKRDMNYLLGTKIFVKILETNGNRMKVHVKSNVLDNEYEFIKVGNTFTE